MKEIVMTRLSVILTFLVKALILALLVSVPTFYLITYEVSQTMFQELNTLLVITIAVFIWLLGLVMVD